VNSDCTAQLTVEVEVEVEAEVDERLDLAKTIYELYSFGLIAEEVDEAGTPRFRLTGRQP
jgi:hypothetical protein